MCNPFCKSKTVSHRLLILQKENIYGNLRFQNQILTEYANENHFILCPILLCCLLRDRCFFLCHFYFSLDFLKCFDEVLLPFCLHSLLPLDQLFGIAGFLSYCLVYKDLESTKQEFIFMIVVKQTC